MWKRSSEQVGEEVLNVGHVLRWLLDIRTQWTGDPVHLDQTEHVR